MMSAHTTESLHLRRPVAGVVLLMLAVVSGLSTVARSSDQTTVDAFAKCLTTKKVTIYGSFWCSHCDDQKKLFGNSLQYVNYVECSQRDDREVVFACRIKQIRYTPTRIFADGERREGMQPLQQLSTKTGCSLP